MGDFKQAVKEAVANERAEIARLVAWFGRQSRIEGKRQLTTHDLSILIARGDRAPTDVEAVNPKWPTPARSIVAEQETL